MVATSTLVQLLIYLVVGGLVAYLCVWILSLLTLPQPVKTAISIIVALIVLLWLLSALGILPRML